MTKAMTGAPPRQAVHAAGADVGSRFRELAKRWEAETFLMSSSTAMVNHPAYQEIISMGEPAVRYLLGALKHSDSHWHAALEAITGENPVNPEDRGNVPKMTADWLAWGRQRGYQ